MGEDLKREDAAGCKHSQAVPLKTTPELFAKQAKTVAPLQP
ncbi:MAG: hypothetical protein HPY66_2170 [Firmicutes bacterium]|nr:hypothetical protein [Bacillota bacterium]